MFDSEFFTALSLGFILGLRHALDSDHLAAVSTVLAERPSWRASGLVGLSWGVGHTAVLLFVGAIVLVLRVPIPEPLAAAAEGIVGVMLIVLGVLLGMKLIRERWHLHHHKQDGSSHLHIHSHRDSQDHGHAHWWRESLRPLCIGMAHGLAGSGLGGQRDRRTDVHRGVRVRFDSWHDADWSCAESAGDVVLASWAASVPRCAGIGECGKHRAGLCDRLSHFSRRVAVVMRGATFSRAGNYVRR